MTTGLLICGASLASPDPELCWTTSKRHTVTFHVFWCLSLQYLLRWEPCLANQNRRKFSSSSLAKRQNPRTTGPINISIGQWMNHYLNQLPTGNSFTLSEEKNFTDNFVKDAGHTFLFAVVNSGQWTTKWQWSTTKVAVALFCPEIVTEGDPLLITNSQVKHVQSCPALTTYSTLHTDLRC